MTFQKDVKSISLSTFLATNDFAIPFQKDVKSISLSTTADKVITYSPVSEGC